MEKLQLRTISEFCFVSEFDSVDTTDLVQIKKNIYADQKFQYVIMPLEARLASIKGIKFDCFDFDPSSICIGSDCISLVDYQFDVFEAEFFVKYKINSILVASHTKVSQPWYCRRLFWYNIFTSFDKLTLELSEDQQKFFVDILYDVGVLQKKNVAFLYLSDVVLTLLKFEIHVLTSILLKNPTYLLCSSFLNWLLNTLIKIDFGQNKFSVCDQIPEIVFLLKSILFTKNCCKFRGYPLKLF